MLGPSLYLIYTADLPTTDNTTIAAFADDTALLAIDSDPALASQKLQQHLDLLQEWFDKWRIKINQTKSSQITFTTKNTNCPPATINSIQIPVYLEWRISGPKTNLAEAHQDKTPATQLKSTTHVMALRTKMQIFSRRQDFNIQMHIKADLDAGIQLWGCAKPSNTKRIQRLQSNVLRAITKAPWYVSNYTLHNDLQIPFILTNRTRKQLCD
jgi:hypothetical protein